MNTTAAANTSIYVSTHGNDAWNGLNLTHISSNNGPKATIKSAVDTVSSGGTIHIANGVYKENSIIIKKNLIMTGANQQKAIIYGKNARTIFTIVPGAHVVINNLTFTNVRNTTINNEGTLTITHSRFINNTSVYVAGAIYNWGTLTIFNSTLKDNRATEFNKNGGHGGAIVNDGILTVINSLLYNNQAYDNGGAIYNDGTLTITNSVLQNNHATIYGGGAVCNYGKSTITYSTLDNNSAKYGGAIYNYDLTLIEFSQIVGNKAATGSAIKSESGKVNAENNWWNLNSPSKIVSGNVIAKSRLVNPLIVYNVKPLNKTVNIGLKPVITLTFSEPIKLGKGSIQLKDQLGSIIPITKIIDNTILTINPQTLLKKYTNYTLILLNRSVTDLSGHSLSNYKTSFTTGPLPTVISTNPVNGALNTVTKEIKVNFNEPIQKGNNLIVLTSRTGSEIPLTIKVHGKVSTITPTKLLAKSTKYVLIFHAGSITDLKGHQLPYYTTSFTTGPLPRVISTSPVNRAVKSVNPKVITVTFNEPIKTVNNSIQLLNNAGIAVPFKTSIKGNVLTVIPNFSPHYISYVNPKSTPNYNINSMKNEGITDVFMLVSRTQGASNYYLSYLPKIKPKFDAAGITLHAWIFPNFTNKDVAKIAAMGINIHIDLEEFGYLPSTEYITHFVAKMRSACIGRTFTVAAMPDAPGVDFGAIYGQDYRLIAPYVNAIVPMLYKGNYHLSDATMTSAAAYMQKEDPGKLWIALQTYSSDNEVITLPASSVLTQINDVKSNADGIAAFRYGLSNFGSIIAHIKAEHTKYTLILHTGSVTDLSGNPILQKIITYTIY